MNAMTLPTPRKPPDSLEERAVRWIIRNPDFSYSQTAALFGVTVNNIRSRIEHRYGTLAEARHYAFQEDPPRVTERLCLTCQKPMTADKTTYICQKCKEAML